MMIKFFRSIGIAAGLVILLIVLPVTGYFFSKTKDLFSFSPETEKKEKIVSTRTLKQTKVVKVKLYGSLSEGNISAPKIRVKKGVVYIQLLKGMVRMGKDSHYVSFNPYQVLTLNIPGKNGYWQMNQATEFPVNNGEIKFAINPELQGKNLYTVVRKDKALDFGALEFAVLNLPTPLGKGMPPKPVKSSKEPKTLAKGKALVSKWFGKVKTGKNAFDLLAKAREKDISSELLPAIEKTAQAMKGDYCRTKKFTHKIWKKMEE